MRKVKYEEMFPDEFLNAVKEMPVFFVPTGLLEWHGDHLPLGQDGMKAYGICLKAAEKLGGGIVLPINYYGRPGFSRYTGTLTYSEACMGSLFAELFEQLKKVGAKVIVVLTGHYGPCQVDFLDAAAKEYMIKNPEVVVIAQPEYTDVMVNGVVPADHAGKWETSMFWHLYPDKVRMERLSDTVDPMMIYENPPNDHYKEGDTWVWSNDVVTGSSRELGEKAIDVITDHLAVKIREVLADI